MFFAPSLQFPYMERLHWVKHDELQKINTCSQRRPQAELATIERYDIVMRNKDTKKQIIKKKWTCDNRETSTELGQSTKKRTKTPPSQPTQGPSKNEESKSSNQ